MRYKLKDPMYSTPDMGRRLDEGNKRIIHVPRRFVQEEWGGTESVILNLSRQQLAHGFAPEIHTSQALKSLEAETWNDMPIRRYKYCYPFLGLSKSEKHALDKKGGNLVSLQLYRRLKQLTGVRIYHAHVLKRMGATVGTIARKRGKPFVVTIHGNVFDVPKEESASVVEAQRGHFEWGKPLGWILRSRTLLNDADAVICVGRSEYEAAKDKLDHDRIYHLSNGVTPEPFARGDRIAKRKELGWGEGTFVFGCISRVDTQKNQLSLLRAFSQFQRMYPDSGVLLAGPITNARYESELRQAIRDLGIGNKVRWLPPVEAESEEHASLLKALDVFVLPSTHEPFGIVVLEAWASKLPVIVSEIGGLAHLVEDRQTGLLCQSGDSVDLIKQMECLKTQNELKNALGRRGYKHMLEKYTWNRIYEDLEVIYQKAEAFNVSKK